MLSDEGGDGTTSSMVRRARSSRGTFRVPPAALGDRGEVRRVALRAAGLRAGVARRVDRVGRLPERLADADFPAGFAFLVVRRALRLAI